MKFHIAVPTFAQEQYLPFTLESLAAQSGCDLVVTVVDGAQSELVRKIVRGFESKLNVELVSEPDRGQADAINKGFRDSRAEILGWLNSDDMLLPGALTKVRAWFESHAQTDVVYGSAIILNEAKHWARLAVPPPFDRDRLCYDDYIVQPSTFWRRKVWDRIGPLSENFHFVMDWDWWLRVSEEFNFQRVEECLSIYRIHDQHKTGSRRDERLQEVLQLVARYAPATHVACLSEIAPIASDLHSLKQRLNRWNLMPLRKLFYPRIYLRHGSRVIEDVLPAVL